ncbi:MAG: DegV family EDD domain-containing protein [Actinobacteria bacterium]|nr:DegV family EDD domain-containing protein [Actinomycetota bacterium]MSW76669.1 DegV family EDD domain-containing protein [Actinomycetota bacterium]MSX91804.1 DegV family EDD domain-containing protein [Actinomycetota bacterium]MSZ82116.1 DegV family EDD domain-containing protein [Actinomycetota bacterium]MTB16955.1 DegV family EDD domain-containing protein [Actinomycetota bacterium]
MNTVLTHELPGGRVIGLCTDSNALLPPDLIAAFGVEVVPLTVTMDDVDHLEGVDLDVDSFYAAYGAERWPQVHVAAPSAGQFAAAYDDLLARGCTEILSIHVCSKTSATINAARLAARGLPVPVRVVDSGTAGFGVGCCVWQAASAIAAGATLEQAAAVAEALTPTIGNVFVIDAPGRDEDAGLDVCSWRPGAVDTVGHVDGLLRAVNWMASWTLGRGADLRVGVGHSSADSAGLAVALEAALSGAANVVEVVRFRITPSVGAFSGPGAAGLFAFPTR